MKTELPTTVHALLNHPGWDGFISDKLGNDLFINDPDRAARIHDAAEDGCDGSTHAEHIEDWREFADILEREAQRDCDGETDDETDENEKAVETAFAALSADIDACEEWHRENGSLEIVVG